MRAAALMIAGAMIAAVAAVWSYPRPHIEPFRNMRYCTAPSGSFPAQPCAVFEDDREVIQS